MAVPSEHEAHAVEARQDPGAQDTERRQFPAQQALVTGKLSPCCKSFPPGSTTSRGEGLCSQLGTPAG